MILCLSLSRKGNKHEGFKKFDKKTRLLLVLLSKWSYESRGIKKAFL